MNGVALQANGYEMHAAFGPVIASDCMLVGLQDMTTAAVNSGSCLQLSIANADRTGRRFDGKEDIAAFVSGKQAHAQSVHKLTGL